MKSLTILNEICPKYLSTPEILNVGSVKYNNESEQLPFLTLKDSTNTAADKTSISDKINYDGLQKCCPNNDDDL